MRPPVPFPIKGVLVRSSLVCLAASLLLSACQPVSDMPEALASGTASGNAAPVSGIAQDDLYEPRKLALIVAIADYKYLSPINSDRDIPLMRAALIHHGFDSLDIEVVAEQHATRDGILTAFNRSLLQRASVGDIVVFHYSGHGHQITDDNGDETDGYDEVLVPYDAPRSPPAGYAGEFHVRDDTLGVLLGLLRRKVGPSGNVLVLIDACYSGSVTRNVAPVRRAALDPIGNPAKTARSEAHQRGGGALYSEGAATRGGEAGAAETDLAPYVVISASRYSEVAQEVEDDEGRYVGSLSLAVSRALGRASQATTYRALFHDIENTMAAMPIENRPQAEGDLDTELFSGWAVSQEHYYLVDGFTSDSKYVRLKAGEILGLIPETEVEFHPAGSRQPEPEARLASGVVVEADLTRALVKVEGTLDADVLEESWAFVTKQSFGDLRIKVAISNRLDAERRERMTAALEESPAVRLVDTEPQVLIDVNSSAEVFAEAVVTGLQIGEAVDPSGRGWTRRITSRVDDYARNLYLRRMNLATPGLDVRFEIIPAEVECKENQLRGGQECEVVRELPLSDKLNDGNELEFEIEDWFVVNVVNDGQASAWVSILDLMPNGALGVLWPPRDRALAEDNVIPAGTAYRLDREIPPLFFRICPPAGREMLKLVASREPINFHLIRTRSKGEGNELEEVFQGIYVGARSDTVRNVPRGGLSTYSITMSVVGERKCTPLN